MTRRYLHLLVLTALFLSLSCATVVQSGKWTERSATNESGGFGEAVVGTGDAITWSEHDDHVYALIGSNEHGRAFARYSYDSWEPLTFKPDWTWIDWV